MKHKVALILFILVLIFCGTIVFESCLQKESKIISNNINSVAKTYIGSAECQKCHPKEFEDWKLSDHFKAMELPNDTSVLGDFNTSYKADGVRNQFFKKDGKFFINTQGRHGNYVDGEVKYTFGYFPLQQYLIAQPGGKLQATRVSWDSKNNKWFHQYPNQKIAANDWLHWTGNGQNWNTMCASCHSTNLKKKYDFVKDEYHTTFSEINVACETCHGAGSAHKNFVLSDGFAKGDKILYAGLSEVTSKNNALQIKNCAPCHARKTDIEADQILSNELLDNIIPEIISNENYVADGQINNEDYEYGSFAQSKMYHNNVTCSNCHNPHSGKLLVAGNAMCISCHDSKFDSPAHHFHTASTESSQCINCHMPEKTYMGNDTRRDHSFRIPRPDQSIVYNTPNTCNSCHKNQTAKWATTTIQKWYGPKRKYHFSDDLLPGSILNNKSEYHLLKLLADSSQPEIARATAVYYLGSLATQKVADALLKSLDDMKAMVRYQTLKSLEKFPPQLWQQAAQKCLTDKVRAVRIAAADLYHRISAQALDVKSKDTYAAADAENKLFLQYQTDFAVGNVMMADYELQGGDFGNAIQHYVRALEKDNQINYARLNLSAAYNSMGKNKEALQVLQYAEKIEQSNDRIYYNMGLLYYEMGEPQKALNSFEKAMKLNSRNPDLYYNYGLLLQQNGNQKQTELVLKKGYALNANSAKLNYALCYFYIQQNNPKEAVNYATVLYQIDPLNPNYQTIYRNLGIIR